MMTIKKAVLATSILSLCGLAGPIPGAAADALLSGIRGQNNRIERAGAQRSPANILVAWNRHLGHSAGYYRSGKHHQRRAYHGPNNSHFRHPYRHHYRYKARHHHYFYPKKHYRFRHHPHYYRGKLNHGYYRSGSYFSIGGSSDSYRFHFSTGY